MPQTAKEAIDELVDRGMGQSEIAEALQRDRSLISQIRRGKKPGDNLRESLTELVQKGSVSTPPARRRTAKGYARVRGKKGQESVLPKEASQEKTSSRTHRKVSRREQVPARGKFEKTTTYGRGFRKTRIDFPRTKGTKGKEQAWNEVGKTLKSASRRKWGAKDIPERRVHIEAVYEDGSRVAFGSKGGYRPESVLGSLDQHAGDAEDWLKSQGLAGRYQDLDPELRMVSIDINAVVR